MVLETIRIATGSLSPPLFMEDFLHYIALLS